MKRDRCFAPTLDHDDDVYVIGHNNKGIQFNQREMARDFLPTTLGDFAGIIQPHFAVHHMAEKALLIPRTDRHKIRPWLGVVMSLQADGAAVVFFGIEPHYPC